MLGQLSEKKAFVYFASGLRLNGLDNQAQLHATVNAAIRAGVAFWPIDARGLLAQAPLGDATKGSPGGVGMHSGTSALAITTNFQKSQDTLFALAADTGGNGPSRSERPGEGHCQRRAGYLQLLHHWLLHDEHVPGRQKPSWARDWWSRFAISRSSSITSILLIAQVSDEFGLLAHSDVTFSRRMRPYRM